MFNKLRLRLKLYRLRAYIRKKLAYHEAGHLIFSYLLKIPCSSVSVDYDFVGGIQFENGSAIVELQSQSQTIHQLSPDLERLLHLSQLGIAQVAVQARKTPSETAKLYHKYLTILLAGRFCEEHFRNAFYDEDLEWLQKNYSKDLTERSLNEDVERFNYLNKGLYSDINELKNTFDTCKATILHYLKQKEVIEAIHLIAAKIKNSNKLERAEFELLFDKIGFLHYCTQQQPVILKMI